MDVIPNNGNRKNNNNVILRICFSVIAGLFAIIQIITMSWVLNQNKDVSETKTRVQILETQRSNND